MLRDKKNKNKKITLKILFLVIPSLALSAFGGSLAILFTTLITVYFDYFSIIMLILDWFNIRIHLYFLYGYQPNPIMKLVLALFFLGYIIGFFFLQKKK